MLIRNTQPSEDLPGVADNLDDGGLLDLNALPAEQRTTFAGLSPEEATSVADACHQLGRFTSLTELALYADLSEPTTAMLSEHAVFI